MKVSIIISAYNCEKYIRETINSVLSQTFKDFELILINDGSSDGTLKVMKEFTDKRIVLLSHKNKGIPVSVNRGIRKARGEYIARMDGDDIMLSDRIESQVKFLDKNSDIAIVGGLAEEMDEEGKKIKTKGRFGVIALDNRPLSPEEINKTLLRFNPMINPTIMGRADIFKKYLYREEFPVAEDYDFFLRVSEKYNIANINKVLIKYRQGSGISTKRMKLVERSTIRVKFDALKRRKSPSNEYKYLIKPVISYLVPTSIKKIILRLIRR